MTELLGPDGKPVPHDPRSAQARAESEFLAAAQKGEGPPPWENRKGQRDPRVQAAYQRMRADLYLVTRWQEVGLEQAAAEACAHWGHLRPRAGMCDRCGQGVPRGEGHHGGDGRPQPDTPRFGGRR